MNSNDIQYYKLSGMEVYLIRPLDLGLVLPWLVYAPLSGKCFIASDFIAEMLLQPCESWHARLKNQIAELTRDQVDVSQLGKRKSFQYPPRLVVIPTQACNLKCTYCYARNAHGSRQIDLDVYKSVVVGWIQKIEASGEVAFIGGGEPLIAWERFQDYVYLTKEEARRRGKRISFSVTTNGTLLDSVKIEWLKENSVRVGVSFDILPGVQDQGRPFLNGGGTHDVVLENIKNLLTMGFDVRIRTTITESCVDLMPEMVYYVTKHIPKVKSIHFEHVTDSVSMNDAFYERFLNSYWLAKKIAKSHSIGIRNSIQTSLSRISMYFCKGEFCLTPDGIIVSCHRVSSERDFLFHEFSYGKAQGGLRIEENQFARVLNRRVRPENCETCFCKWHCSGGCPIIDSMCDEEKKRAYCRFIRKFTSRLLVERQTIGKEVKK